MTPDQRQRMVSGRPNVLLGIVLSARGRPEGLNHFGDSTNSFLASLAPLIAFPLVGGGLMLAQGGGLGAVGDFLEVLCALLAPAVISHFIAGRWGREAAWMRYATAFNWCQWVMPVVLSALLVVLGLAIAVGLPNQLAGILGVAALIAYGLWLHWFLARNGLQLSKLRAAGLVLTVNFGTTLIVVIPQLLTYLAEKRP
jgi:hypothetical protein